MKILIILTLSLLSISVLAEDEKICYDISFSYDIQKETDEYNLMSLDANQNLVLCVKDTADLRCFGIKPQKEPLSAIKCKGQNHCEFSSKFLDSKYEYLLYNFSGKRFKKIVKGNCVASSSCTTDSFTINTSKVQCVTQKYDNKSFNPDGSVKLNFLMPPGKMGKNITRPGSRTP